MRSIVPIVGVVALVLAGCGGSARSSSVSAPTSRTLTGTSSTPPSTSSTTTTSTSTSSTSTTSTPTTLTSTTATSATATSTTSTTSTTTAAPAGPELPANFTIKTGGTLSPPSVSAPGRTPILLTISTTDARTHQVALGTPQGQRLTAKPGHPGRVLLKGLRDGAYTILVDGQPRGKLIVGATPGP